MHLGIANTALALLLVLGADAAAAQSTASAPDAPDAPDVLLVRIPPSTQLQVGGARMPDGSAVHTFTFPHLDGRMELSTPVRTIEPAGWQVPLYRGDTRLTVGGVDVPLDERTATHFEGAVVIDSALFRASFANAVVETFADSVVVRPGAPQGGR